MTTDTPHSLPPGRALFQLVRYWSRRWTGAGHGVEADRGRDVMVTEAVASLQAEHGATVNDVANELGIDQSGASRFISQAVEGGFLSKIPSPHDGRQRLLIVTAEGEDLLEAAHQWQEFVFAELTNGWPADDVQCFHNCLERFIAAQRKQR